jgi:hypothetical protein
VLRWVFNRLLAYRQSSIFVRFSCAGFSGYMQLHPPTLSAGTNGAGLVGFSTAVYKAKIRLQH